jgi:hypothetical protein
LLRVLPLTRLAATVEPTGVVDAGDEKVEVDETAIGRPARRDATNLVVVEVRDVLDAQLSPLHAIGEFGPASRPGLGV